MSATKVLLVEDEGIIRMMAAEFLRDEGFDVNEAWDGDEAVRLLDGSDYFDVLFTDVQMPGKVDGLGVAAHARQRHPAIPVLVVSGYAAQLQVRLAALHPAAVFIVKPYEMEHIIGALRKLTRAI